MEVTAVKKMIAMVLCLVLILSLAGCGGIKHPSVQEYAAGQGNIRGNVDTDAYYERDERFEIGATKEGYFAAARIIAALLAGETTLSAYAVWLLAALAGYLARTVLYNGALSISHKATFSILKTIRQLLLQKLPRLPLGTVVDTASGKLKQIIVDQVDSMETTLAHLFPEMTANITAPVLTLIYLFILDWRLALLSLAVFPIAFFFMMMVMGGYAKDFAGAVQATGHQ